MGKIHIHFQNRPKFRIQSILFRKAILEIITKENYSCDHINIILCDDEYLLEINKKFLNHDYYTDVITFDYTERGYVSGEIYISIIRIEENAEELGLPVNNELSRVIIHGVLHLMGYRDGSTEEKKMMTEKEDFYLPLFFTNSQDV